MPDIGKGDLVICVDAKPNAADPKAALLCEGMAYRVAACGEGRDGRARLAFRRLGPKPSQGWAWSLYRFRPFDEGDRERLREMFDERVSV